MAARASEAGTADARVRAAFGPTAVEALLLADVRGEVDAVRRDPRRLALPLRILVPSQSLRDHLSSALVRGVRPSVAGVSIQTLHGFAASVVERDAALPPRGARVFETLVRRAASAEPQLADELGQLEDGTAVLAAAIADLLDAGFRDEHAPALLDALGSGARRSAPGGSRTLERARSLVRAARSVAREMSAQGLERASGVLTRARDVLDEDPSRARSRAIWIVGFSDATGIALDLIATLQDRCSGRIYDDESTAVDAAEGRVDVFGRRFRSRLGLAPRAASEAPPDCACFAAPGAQAEARAVAVRVRALLDAGERPESVGVVARELEPWSATLRLHFNRLAIPYSGVAGRGPASIEGRRAAALAELVGQRERLAIERWFDLRACTVDAASRSATSPPAAAPFARADHISLAFRAMGCARIDALCDVDLAARLGSRASFALPIRGVHRQREDDEPGSPALDEDGDEDAPPIVSRRSVSRPALEHAQSDARALRDHLARAPRRAAFRQHAAHLRALVSERLGWSATTPGHAAFARALDDLAEDVPADLELSGDEFADLATRALAEAAAAPLGGAGGGVQCLSVVEARARTFEHLFLIGLNDGSFPRRISEDPLLPDGVRARLLAHLPSLPIKSAGHSEERALFAQLLRASPHVTLSWQSVDDDGAVMRASPLVERWLARAHAGATEPGGARSLGTDVALAPPLYPRNVDERSLGALRPRPAHEHAVIAALSDVRRARASLAQVLPVALREARASAGLAPPAAELARAQLAILDEIDAPVSRRASAGPYLGFVGTVDARDDPRRADLWVTHLESMAACPWRTFVERVLHLAPAPDPLSELSDIDARTLGLAIHAALDAVARVPHRAPGADLAQAVAVLPAPIAWPDEAELDALLADVAQRVLRDEGLALPGLERVLALRMRPYVEAARAIDRAERDDALGVLATEACGRVDIDDGCGGARSLSFVADRVDALRTGLRLTDFKTGKPFVPDGKPETRAKHFLQRVARGTHLQAAAYAAAAGDGARGSYLFLAPDVDARARRLAVEAADDAFRTAFRDATRILATAWRGGAFVPRLVDEKLEKEPRACSLCEVASACVRGDSGMRQRLTTWLRARRDDDARALDSAEAIGAAMWRMGAQANERAAAPGAE